MVVAWQAGNGTPGSEAPTAACVVKLGVGLVAASMPFLLDRLASAKTPAPTATRPTTNATAPRRLARSRRDLFRTRRVNRSGSTNTGRSSARSRPARSSSSFDIVLLLLVDLQACRERRSRLGQRVLDRSFAHPESLGDLACVELQEVAKDRDLSLASWKSRKRTFDVQTLDAAGVIARERG